MRVLSLTILLVLCTTFAYADESKMDTRPSIAPDIREDESKLKQQKVQPASVTGAGGLYTDMVLKAKRINLRVDYARSKGSDAIHVAVGEAF